VVAALGAEYLFLVFFCKILQLNDLAEMVLKTMDLGPIRLPPSEGGVAAPGAEYLFLVPYFCKILLLNDLA
jgi:hypothetical protein